MDFAGLNYVAVMLAAAASFIFGGVWYGVFSNVWMSAAGLTIDDLKSKDGPILAPYIIAFLAELVMALILAGVIGHLGSGQVTIKNGLISAALIWAGFVVTSLIVNHTFQGARRVLTLIDGGHWLGVLTIQGAVIGWMGTH